MTWKHPGFIPALQKKTRKWGKGEEREVEEEEGKAEEEDEVEEGREVGWRRKKKDNIKRGEQMTHHQIFYNNKNGFTRTLHHV